MLQMMENVLPGHVSRRERVVRSGKGVPSPAGGLGGSRGFEGASAGSPAGSGAESQTHFWHILGHRTLLVERKM